MIFNELIACSGGSGGGYKMSTPSSHTQYELQFPVDNEPSEFYLMGVHVAGQQSTSSGNSTYYIVDSIMENNTVLSTRVYGGSSGAIISGLSGTGTSFNYSYSNGVLTFTGKSTSAYYRFFASNRGSYYLFYK